MTANTVPATNATTAATRALAAWTRSRLGTHSREARTLPVEYSEVTATVASTTTANWTRTAEEAAALPTGWMGSSLIREIEA
ncbi:hypothetical protein ACF09C_31180 [Streptomyces sp. NPDC014870]|uniref:hypothetical protein n=1 Tax=Streptomyces sp. NPDC014870 TaxID=3364925 RepID=UPI0037034D40